MVVSKRRIAGREKNKRGREVRGEPERGRSWQRRRPGRGVRLARRPDSRPGAPRAPPPTRPRSSPPSPQRQGAKGSYEEVGEAREGKGRKESRSPARNVYCWSALLFLCNNNNPAHPTPRLNIEVFVKC